MLKKELVTKGLVKFDDNPVTHRVWKATFKGVVEGLGLSAREEADLLVKWLGPKPSKLMMRLREVHPRDPESGLKTLWSRLEREYGAPELIECLLLSQQENFSKIGQRKPKKLQELTDLLPEIAAAKKDVYFPGLVFLDTSKG
ncbi:hypothetical protein HOLleu_36978 [Holothuria leucospilota]|uniref:Uncharacterized protein n=1 Tax=Holothuria leucospilota TaxID=206669 RepID=A0A9Q0YQ51_HOLLE|nr:hypothetical protein HOLleu_36978 [Holothuria leucospilota]